MCAMRWIAYLTVPGGSTNIHTWEILDAAAPRRGGGMLASSNAATLRPLAAAAVTVAWMIGAPRLHARVVPAGPQGFFGDWREVYPDGTHRTSSSFFSTALDGTISIVGSDDGNLFWTLHGTVEDWATRRLVVDFSAKVLPNGYTGPRNLGGQYVGDRITWDDGNQWLKEEAPPWQKLHFVAGRSALQGIFKLGTTACPADAAACKASFSGMRMISDADGVRRDNHLTIIGSDDARHFWKLGGSLDRSSGRLVVDFSAIGGSNQTGVYDASSGALTWDHEEPAWQLVAPEGPRVLWPSSA